MLEILDHDNGDKSDLSRLYYILTSISIIKLKLGFIPFECVERTKKFYKIFKNNIQQRLKDEYENNKIMKEMLCTFSVLPIFGLGLYYAFKNTKGEN